MSAQLEPRRFNVTEYYQIWLVNIPKETIEVYFDLQKGKYRKCQKYKRGETVDSPTVKGISLGVNEILG
jgi:Uma2 family endonuclease